MDELGRDSSYWVGIESSGSLWGRCPPELGGYLGWRRRGPAPHMVQGGYWAGWGSASWQLMGIMQLSAE